MKLESIVLAVAGMCFGVIVGWMLATLDADRTARELALPVQQAQSAAAGNTRQTPPLDEAKVQGLITILNSDPSNAGAAVELATTYFEAEQFDEAAKWYEQALKSDPKNVTAMAQLGMTYFLLQRTEPALAQFEASLKVSPDHPTTLLNKGIVLWRGKNDLKGAQEAWERLVKLAPDSQEAQIARQGLTAMNGEQHKDGAPANQ
jgi:tetratricopeptide (TPR) repeat protein